MNLKSLILTVSIGLLVTSCGSDELMYSCDRNVDQWVKDHIDEIRQMNRKAWLNSDADYAIAMYRAFSTKQRIVFWREKFDELKKMEWNKEEKKHILDAEIFFESHLNLFDGNQLSEEEVDTVDLFIYEWKEKAINELGWTETLVGAIIASGYTPTDTTGTIQIPKNNLAGAVLSATTETCNCHVGSWWTCLDYTTCHSATCNGSGYGCGGFLLYSCDGKCSDY